MATRREEEFRLAVLAAEAELDRRAEASGLADELAEDRLDEALASTALERALGNIRRKKRLLDQPTPPEGIDLPPNELARRPGLLRSEREQGVVRTAVPPGPAQADLGLNGEVRHYAPPPIKPKQPSAKPADRGEQADTLFENPRKEKQR